MFALIHRRANLFRKLAAVALATTLISLFAPSARADDDDHRYRRRGDFGRGYYGRRFNDHDGRRFYNRGYNGGYYGYGPRLYGRGYNGAYVPAPYFAPPVYVSPGYGYGSYGYGGGFPF